MDAFIPPFMQLIDAVCDMSALHLRRIMDGKKLLLELVIPIVMPIFCSQVVYLELFYVSA